MAITFESMNLRPELLEACRKQGFRGPTPIQALVIPAVMKGRDVVVEAKTGSGKTLAYGLPVLNVDPRQSRGPEVLVLVPTRELADQIHAELTRSAGKLERGIVSLTGRGGMDRQKAALDAGASIVVGTMGRIEELVARKLLRLDQIHTLVLDEVDELMSGGFSANLAALLKQLPVDRQTLLFSATVPNAVEQVTRQFMRQPQRLRLTEARDVPIELSHRILRTSVDSRIADLRDFLKAERPYQTLLFCGTRKESEEVHEALVDLGLEAEFLHGELSAVKRRKLLERFRTGELPILVASDLVARGIDLPGVDLVVNYSLPEGVGAYLHRAGRTGRAGRPGTVVSLLIPQQQDRFEKLKQTLTFEGLEVKGTRVKVHALKSREERDLEFRRLPRGPRPSGAPAGQQQGDREEAAGRAPRRSGPRAGPRRGERQEAEGRGSRRSGPRAGKGSPSRRKGPAASTKRAPKGKRGSANSRGSARPARGGPRRKR